MALRPALYDGEVVYLVTLLQNLGRLIVQYHFADETAQIRRLMQPSAPQREGEAPDPGMSEEGAAYAVLGADIEAIGHAVARWWGLEESVLTMIRRLPAAAPAHAAESDDDMLRMVASCANEAIDALALAPAKVQAALQRVVQRYGRPLDLSLRTLQEALQAPAAGRIAHTAPTPLEGDATARSGVLASASPSSLRAAAAQRRGPATRAPG
jgi:non-specific serine/threonine protein kinase